MAGSPRIIKFSHVKRKLKVLDIIWVPQRGRGSHGCLIGPNQKTKGKNTFPIPKNQQREINIDYLKALGRRFGLTKKQWAELFD